MKIFIYSILFSLLFSTGARLRVCINYLVNQKYYAEVLCKNKAVKNSCCKGKCAVEKELSDLEKKQEPGTDSSGFKLSKAEEAICSVYEFRFTGQSTTLSFITHKFRVDDGYQRDLIKPPSSVVNLV